MRFGKERVALGADVKPGVTGGIPGPCPLPKRLLVPPQTKVVPPKRELYPEEINRLGATGVQIEA